MRVKRKTSEKKKVKIERIKFMRVVLSYDVHQTLRIDQKKYAKFIKKIKEMGFVMLHESLYFKLVLNWNDGKAVQKQIRNITSNMDGNIITFCMTEREFANIDYVIGNFKSEVLTDTNRVVKL